MGIVIQKYGGSSVRDTDHIERVAERIAKRRRKGDDLVVVVSAMANTTDELVNLARSIDPSPPEREFDMLLTAGERVTMTLLSMAIQKRGERAVSYTGSQSGIITDDDHTRARIMEVRAGRIVETLNSGAVAIVAGFQGVSGKRDVTTLGRGGSDTTAVALGVALGAEICEIYTDVDGIYSADPRRVRGARPVPELTYCEVLDMAYFGAKVIHSRAVEMARVHRLPLRVTSSMKKTEGSRIVGKVQGMERPRIVGVSTRKNICLCSSRTENLAELRELLSALENARVRVGFPRMSEDGEAWKLDFWADSVDADRLRELSKRFDITLTEKVCLIGLVGEEIAQRSEVLAEVLELLEESGVRPLLMEATLTSIGLVLPDGSAAQIEDRMHQKFVKGSPFETG